jgi:hypothetical protein
MKELHDLEFEKKYVGYFENKKEWADWYHNNDNAFGKRFTTLANDMSEIEKYLLTKRKRVWVPETLTNPFHLDFRSTDCISYGSGVFNFCARRDKKEYKLTGKCKDEYNIIMDMVRVVNMDKSVRSLKVFVSPIKKSLRGDSIKNSWAIKIIYPDGSINVFYHIIGMYHIATNISES